MNDSDAIENVQPKSEDVYDRKTILVADDSNIIRNFVKRVFESEYNVGVAQDVEEAIRVIEANKDNIERVVHEKNIIILRGGAICPISVRMGKTLLK